MSVDWHEARRICSGEPAALAPVRVPLAEACGRRLVGDLRALCAVPHYASSAMDGWAVSGAGPWRVVRRPALGDGEAAAIVTGGLVPEGASAVVRSEHADETGGLLRLNPAHGGAPPDDRENIREAGEEVDSGAVVFPAGTVLAPPHLAVAAVCGHDDLRVLARPRVGMVFTGDEVVTSGIPAPGFVRDTFGPQIPDLIGELGGEAGTPRRIGDDRTLMIDAVAAAAAESEVVITTGGTGRSVADHLHGALDALDARMLIDGVAMRPGHPCVLAHLPGGAFVVGLPGNPLAAIMGTLSLLGPLLAALSGAPAPSLGTVALGESLPASPGRHRLVPYELVDGRAVQSAWRGSGMLRGLANAAGVLVGPPEGAEPGTEVETLPLPWL